MRRKSPSSPKPSAQLPAKQLISPLLPLFAPSSAPRPASTSSSAMRAADGCPSPDTFWAQPDRTDWDFDNNIYCDSTGCSYDAKKNPRIAKFAITVVEFDDCSYEEYEDTVFLCGQCNLKCLRKVNGSKIKSKMPIERFLKQRESEDHSDSFAVDALDLPLPPPTAADFPELPRAAPAPKMTKAEKAMAAKIDALLLSSVKGKHTPKPAGEAHCTAEETATEPAQVKGKRTPGPAGPPPCLTKKAAPARIDTEPVPVAPEQPRSPVKTMDELAPGIIPIPADMRSEILSSSPVPSGTATPIGAMAALHAQHAVSCPHDTNACGICRVGITCCKCQLMYTAPAAKRMRCVKCLHWACDLDQSNNCCECNTPWIPMILRSPEIAPSAKQAARLRGGVGSDNTSEASSAGTTHDDSTVKVRIAPPTQESLDEIDALSRPSTAKPAKEKGKPQKQRQPKSGDSSREPSRPLSVASDRLSTTETVLPKPDYEVPPLAHEYNWAPPPADVKSLPGYVYEAHQEKTLHVDDDDVAHFLKRGDVDINDISNQLDVLLSGNTSWKTMYHAITDIFQFDMIAGSRLEFMCFLIGLARSWDDDAECNPAGIVKNLINDASSLVKTEEELHMAQTTLSRIRNERNQAMTDVKKLSETCDRLRKDRNKLKTALEDIINSGGAAPTKAQFEGLQEEIALLKDEKAGLVKVIEHDKAALRTAEDENTAMTLQISLMNEDIDDKNALIEEVQSAASGMMKEYGKLEILHTTVKHELESAKSVITTMKVQHESEQKVYESRIQRLKSRDAGETSQAGASAGDPSLRKELAIAKERIAFLEKAYKQKSDALKTAESTSQKAKAQQAPSKTTTKPPGLPKWGFEPSDDLPNSQPYWDYRNAYSDHIAAMVAATVTAIPHIPLSSAISSAISTVSKAGPPPELTQKTKGKRPIAS